MSSGTSGAELPVRCAVVPSTQKSADQALPSRWARAACSWWAVTLIVLGACAVFAAAVVGANLIVRTYQRRILGSFPLLAPPRGRALLESRSVVAWRKLLLNALAFPWRRPGPRSSSGDALLAPLLLRIDGDDAGSVGAEDTSAVESRPSMARLRCAVCRAPALPLPTPCAVCHGGCAARLLGASRLLAAQQLTCCCGCVGVRTSTEPLAERSR